MEDYLFLVSIGPVQTFIASARRSRDLWFGSTLLSELARAAAAKIAETKITGEQENSLIFPTISSQDLREANPEQPVNVANKIIARIHQSPTELAQEVHDAIFERLHQLRELAYADLGKFDREIAEAQVDDLVEYLWVALPFDGSNYAAILDNLEALMAARKNTRDFQPVQWGADVPRQKSSIDGQLESVIPEWRYPNRRTDSAKKRLEKTQLLYNNYRAGPSEQLSGVDLLKRNGRLTPGDDASTHFPSTSHIAALPFLAHLDTLSESDQAEAKKNWDLYISELKLIALSPRLERIPRKYKSHLIVGDYDGSLLFEERWVDLIGDIKDVRQEKKDILENADKALTAFFEVVRAHPDPYYAILLADGDGMGKVIDAQAKEGEEAHRKLSQSLNGFADKAREIVENENQGALVYSGGDDVLAFIPLHRVLQCAQTLQEDFRQKLEPFKDTDGNSPTLSIGIVIVHHLFSLREALNLARAAEKRAKKVPRKNALAITVSKRSGDDYSVAGHWGDLDTHLDTLIELSMDDVIPAGMAYELRDLALRLQGDDKAQDEQLRRAMFTEARRIVKRKKSFLKPQPAQDTSEGTDNRLDTLLKRLDDAEKLPSSKGTGPVSLEQISHELIIARILADARRLATR
jgi:CRISPR-associated protein Cmr2